MEKQKKFNGLFGERLDGVIESAHYQGGKLNWVRAYERRGPTWSDHVLLDRERLVQRLKDGKRFRIGQRVAYKASEFTTGPRVTLVERDGMEWVVTEDVQDADGDRLADVPIV
jgi:hypothetical protein